MLAEEVKEIWKGRQKVAEINEQRWDFERNSSTKGEGKPNKQSKEQGRGEKRYCYLIWNGWTALPPLPSSLLLFSFCQQIQFYPPSMIFSPYLVGEFWMAALPLRFFFFSRTRNLGSPNSKSRHHLFPN